MFFAEAAFVLIVLAAAASDVISYRIPNSLVLALAGVFLIWAGVHYAETAWLSHFAAALLCLAAGFVLYQVRQMGAGDVKLLTAVALWAGLNGLLALLLFMSLSGLLVLPLILFARFLLAKAQARNVWKPQWAVPRVLTKREGVLVTMIVRPFSLT